MKATVEKISRVCKYLMMTIVLFSCILAKQLKAKAKELKVRMLFLLLPCKLSL
jgi:hypothetical protein